MTEAVFGTSLVDRATHKVESYDSKLGGYVLAPIDPSRNPREVMEGREMDKRLKAVGASQLVASKIRVFRDGSLWYMADHPDTRTKRIP